MWKQKWALKHLLRGIVATRNPKHIAIERHIGSLLGFPHERTRFPPITQCCLIRDQYHDSSNKSPAGSNRGGWTGRRNWGEPDFAHIEFDSECWPASNLIVLMALNIWNCRSGCWSVLGKSKGTIFPFNKGNILLDCTDTVEFQLLKWLQKRKQKWTDSS